MALLIGKLDPNLLKAKFFLESDRLRNQWLYITAAGAVYFLREMIGVYQEVYGGETYGFYGLTETLVFVIILALVWQWHSIICACQREVV